MQRDTSTSPRCSTNSNRCTVKREIFAIVDELSDRSSKYTHLELANFFLYTTGMDSCRILSIPNSRGEKMIGVLEDTGSDHIVILCHGFQSSKVSLNYFVVHCVALDTFCCNV